MSERLVTLLVRLAGSDPGRVRLLRHWFARAVAGQMAFEQERRMGPGFAIDMAVVRLYLGVMAIFYSIGLGVLLVFVDPVLSIWILAGAHNLVMATLLAAYGYRTWLGEDDARIIGWWPVSIRDATLARTAMLVAPAVQLTLACTTIPLLVLTVVGEPPVLSGVLLSVGVLLQTLGHLLLGLTVATGLGARLGARRARRWFPLVYLFASILPWTFLLLLPNEAAAVTALPRDAPWPVTLTPPGWVTSWGLLLVSPRAWAGALVGLVVVAAWAPLTARVLLPRRQGQALEPGRATVGRFPFVRLLETLLWPFAPGREGWIVRRLTAAHLRDDPYAATTFAIAPLVLLLELGALLLDPGMLSGLSEGIEGLPVRASVFFPFPALLLPIVTIPQLVYSTHARAAWCIAAGELDPRRVFAAQRGVARALVLAPMLVGFLVLHLRAGTASSLIVSDLAYSFMLWELACAGVQQLYPILPFSRSRLGGGQELIPVAVLIHPVAILFTVWAGSVHELFWAGRIATWAALGLLVLSLHRRLVRQAGGRLPIEIASPS